MRRQGAESTLRAPLLPRAESTRAGYRVSRAESARYTTESAITLFAPRCQAFPC
jgi:hypothetical protein